MKRFLLLLVVASAVFAGPIQIEIFPILGPESGPNFDIWAENVISALRAGPIPSGPPAGPTDVTVMPVIRPADIVYSPDGESWRGEYGVPGQTGSVLYFPVRIWSTDTSTFTLNDVEFRQTSGAGNWWGWPDPADPTAWDSLTLPTDTFNFFRVGIRASDGTVMDAPTWSRNTPMSALYWIGLPGGGLWAEDPGPGRTLEEMLELAIREVAAVGVHRVVAEYRVNDDDGNGIAWVVPEPGAAALIVLGFGLLWAGRRRR
jgi:hypothetical protein